MHFLQAVANLLGSAIGRKRTEVELQESEERFRLMADHAPVLIWVCGTDKACNWLNQPWLTFTGRTMDQELGDGWAEGVHPQDFDRCQETYVSSFDARQPFRMEYRLRRHDGAYRWVLDHGIPRYSMGGEFAGYIRSCIDITDRKELEREVLEIAAREQRRIGQELHDGTGQELTALALLAEALTEVLPNAHASANLAVKISAGLKRALTQVRSLSRGLIPVEIDAEGLMTALEVLAARTNEVSQISCDFDCHEPVLVENNQTATQLYRIAQEAVTNALKHSGAHHIAISLKCGDGLITLRILDDGVGLPKEALEGSGLGLEIMRYRARLINAQLKIERAEPVGTFVNCTVNKAATHDR